MEEKIKTATHENGNIFWYAWDVTDNKEIYKAPNGAFVEAAARNCIKETGHKVIVGMLFYKEV